MASTPEARILLTARDATKAAFNSVNSNLDEMDSKVLSVAKSLARVAGPAVVAGFGAFIKSTASAAKELEDLQLQLGINVEAFQDLRNSAELAGISGDQFGQSLQRQVRRIGEAASGTGEAVKALDALGLSAKALNQLSPEDQFNELAEALRGVSTQGEQVALAMRFWDQEGVRNLRIVNQTTEELQRQADAYTELSEDAIESFANIQTFFNELFSSAKALGNELANVLAPAVDRVLDSFRDVDEKGVAALQTEIGRLNESLQVLEQRRKVILRLNGDTTKIDNQIGELNTQLDANIEAWRNLEKASIANSEATNTEVQAVEESTRAYESKARAVRQVVDEYDAMDVALSLAIQEEKNLVREEAKRILGLQKIAEETENVTEAVEEQANEIPELYKDAARNINSAFTDAFRSILDSSEDWFDNLKDSLLSGFKDLLAQMLTLAAKPIVLNIVTGIGGALGVSGGALAGLTEALGGGTATAGGFGLPIALGLGALGLGAVLTDIFKGSPDEQRVGFSTGGPFDSDISATIKTAFGEVGFAESSNNLKGAALDLLKSVQTFDNTIAEYLSPEDVERVSEALQGVGVVLDRVTFESEDLAYLLEERARAALEALGLPVDKLADAGDSLEDVGNAVQEILLANDAIQGFIDSADPKTLTQAEQSVEALNKQIEELTRLAEDFGFGADTVGQLEGAGQDILTGWVDDFNRMVEDELLKIDDPVEFAQQTISRAFDEWRDDLIASATALGADMDKVWELIDAKAAERDADLRDLESSSESTSTTSVGATFGSFVETWDAMFESIEAANDEFIDFKDSVDDFIRSLKQSDLSYLSPLDKLSEAEKEFYLNPTPETAQDYVSAAAAVYSGTQAYKDIFDQVEEVLGQQVTDRQDAVYDLHATFYASALDSLEAISRSNVLIYRGLVDILNDRYSLDQAA